MARAPRVSAPLVAAVTEATTASRFFLEWVFSSPSAAMDFSTESLNALLPAAVNCSAVFLTAVVATVVSPWWVARAPFGARGGGFGDAPSLGWRRICL